MSDPELSVLMVGRGPRAALRSTLHHLSQQSARDRFEVVLVTDAPAALAATVSEMGKYLDIRVVEVPPIVTSGAALAAGVRSARAPVVAYAEEHAFPAPGWAEALIEAHSGPWAAVSAVLSNANPGSDISKAHFVLAFGPWITPVQAGVVRRCASHNSAYKRDVLLSYGDSLAEFMETEGILQEDLLAHGHQFYVEPAARTAHLNVSRLRPFLGVEFQGGRMFGFARARRGAWSGLRRMLYALGSPLVPVLRLRRLRGDLGEARLVGRFGALLVAGMIAHTVGEAIGYVAGRGRAGQLLCCYELERRCYLSARDGAAYGAPG